VVGSTSHTHTLSLFADVTLPDKSEDYIHRVGRVGRADRLGLAISIVAPRKEKVSSRCEAG
jgi:ATP-dependent RNA helicase DDX1